MTNSSPTQILFVCTGNTCRSPMAEAYARHLCRSIEGWHFASAGVFAREGQPASPQAVTVMAESGIDISGHLSRQLTPQRADESDYIVALTEGHADLIRENFPEAVDKIHTLHSFNPANAGRDVLDPFGGSVESYRKTRDEIESALSDLILTVVTPSLKTQQEKL
ncbi:low molecular weight protein arginine phosphatase [Kiritimatiellaeota bacterium B1221]|nr:low molecular weight protein arginine phosphatase [Kiritimatiellaeota bacterium B1221]